MAELAVKIQDPDLYSPLTLAFIGDAVYEVLVRERLLEHGSRSAGELHKMAVMQVKASAQAGAYEFIRPALNERESAVMKRGRNANGTHVPKNSSPADYRRATGLEALFGWLYLHGERARIRELFDMIEENSKDIGGEDNVR